MMRNCCICLDLINELDQTVQFHFVLNREQLSTLFHLEHIHPPQIHKMHSKS